MKFALLPVFAAAALWGQSIQSAEESPSWDPAGDLNVNSRYTVESISFLGQHHYKLSSSALEEMHRLIGAKLNTEALNGLAKRIRGELRAHEVTFKLDRGRDPGSVRVLLEVDKGSSSFDLSVPRFAYNSELGWTGIGEASTAIHDNVLTFDLVRDVDTLAERYAGIQARYDRLSMGSDRIRLGFEFDAYHEQYDPGTRLALDNSTLSSSLGAGLYRSRLNFEPSATFVLAKPLTITVGLSFEQLQPELSAARSESANAVVNTLRYHQRWEGSGATKQELDAGYSLRAATRIFGSDLGYTRHTVNVRYGYTHDHQSVEVALVTGIIYGHAPLFERFVLGNSTLLRGWNMYAVDPLGGNRLAYGSVTYGYHIMRVFYDAGSVWNQGQSPEAKQSAGIGISSGLGLFQKGAFLLAVAFPLRQSHMDPVLIAGMNF
ncbi:MAG TPA: BamA/TamA family outer membrane protein [Bryobacteraceae bacterium]|nr:BamA/TamA family outer membrane protein [Bryobacteraceae bacterium]